MYIIERNKYLMILTEIDLGLIFNSNYYHKLSLGKSQKVKGKK